MDSQDATKPPINPKVGKTTRSWNAAAMSNWRERGYVPDSDDEEEEVVDGGVESADSNVVVDSTKAHGDGYTDCSNNGQPSNVQIDCQYQVPQSNLLASAKRVNNHHLTTAGERSTFHGPQSLSNTTTAKLEAEIQRGLQAIRDVLGPQGNGMASDTDSPLSSPPSSAQSSPLQGAPILSTPSVASGRAAVGDSSDGALSQKPAVLALKARSLRTRAPIQMHPYALEDARYRQSWKDRGLQPVRVPQEAVTTKNATEEDSQGTETYESSQIDVSGDQLRLSSSISTGGDDDSQSPIRGTRGRASPSLLNSDDDLPDLSEIVKGKAMRASTHTLKTAKRLSKRRTRTINGEFCIFDLPTDDKGSQNRSRRASSSFIVPPSPPGSHGASVTQGSALISANEASVGDRTPALLPTPDLSSDKQGQKRRFHQNHSPSDRERVVISDDSSTSSTSSESSEDESQGVHRIQRKIRGVLPASWLKLDMKTQQKSIRETRRQARLSIKSALEKGIAQRISTSATGVRHGASAPFPRDGTVLFASSESDSDEPTISEDNDMLVETPEDFDIMEDNTVDAMLAPRQRNRPVKKKQQRLKDSWSSSKAVKSGRRGNTVGHSSQDVRPADAALSTTIARPRKKTKRKHRGLQMTVLDAPGFKDKDVPLFLRIARRRNGAIGEQRSQDPSKKFFRLATTKDTLDVNEELGRWRGVRTKLRPAATHDDESSTRITLRRLPRTLDDKRDRKPATTIGRNQIQLTSLKQTTEATLERVRKNKNETRSLPTNSFPRLQDRSYALLDYFNPRQTRRTHLDPPQAPLSVGPTGDAEDPKVQSSKQFSVLRRVPKPPRRRQEPPYQPPSWVSSSSSRTESQRRMSRPLKKKQCPMPLNPHRDTPTDQQLIYLAEMDGEAQEEIPDFELVDEDDIISKAIKCSPGNLSLQTDDTLQDSALLRHGLKLDGLIKSTIRYMSDVTRLFRPSTSRTAITTPVSGQMIYAGEWDAQTGAIIIQSFSEIISITCHGLAATHTAIQERSFLLGKAAQTLESVITYVNESLSFSDFGEIEPFINGILNKIDYLLRDVSNTTDARSEPHASGTLVILNRLMVLGNQIHDVAIKMTCIEQTTLAKSSDIREIIATLALPLALRDASIEQLFSYISVRSGNDAHLGAAPLRSPTAELETIVLINSLCCSKPWDIYLKMVLSDRVSERATELYPAESLACNILALGCLVSVLGPDEFSAGSDLATNIWFDRISASMSDFLKYFFERKTKLLHNGKGQKIEKLERFGTVMFHWCLLLTSSVKTDGVADNLLKMMFKHYSEKHDMLDLFSVTSTQVPRFLDHQLAPSQLVPEASDTDFHIFLKLAARTLAKLPESDSQNADMSRKLWQRKVSLLFSLLPNTGRDDEPLLIEEDQPLSVQDLAALANRYSLFSTIYHYSPANIKPDLSKIRFFVEFSTAHDAVCGIILQCWATITKSAISVLALDEVFVDLSAWIDEMLAAIKDKLKAIPDEGTKHSNKEGDLHLDDGRWHEFQTHRANRDTAHARLWTILKTYGDAIDICTLPDQAVSLMPPQVMSNMIKFCYPDQGLDTLVISKMFDAVTCRVKKGLGMGTTFQDVIEFQRELREVLTKQLESPEPLKDILLHSMVQTWFSVAKLTVDCGACSWDLFLEPWSNLSFKQIADTENGRSCNILLMSKLAVDRKLVETNTFAFFRTWVSAIVLPDIYIRFEHHLTNQLMETAADVLDLHELRQRLSNGTPRFLLDREDLMTYRLEIVSHLIRSIAFQDDEMATDFVGNMTRSTAERLLSTITDTIKRNWSRVRAEENPGWTVFVRRVIFKLDTHKFSAFEVDPFFLDTDAEYFTDMALYLERLFLFPAKGPGYLDEENTVNVFRLGCERACYHKCEDEWQDFLSVTFAADNPSYVDENGDFLLNIPAQLIFLKGVFPAYIERAFSEETPGPLLTPAVVAASIQILEKLESRIDLESQLHMEEFAEFTVALMLAAVKALRSNKFTFFRDMVVRCELRMLTGLLNLCKRGCGRWVHLQQLFPTSERILALQPYVQVYTSYVYDYVGSFDDYSCSPSDPEFWEQYPNGSDRAERDFGYVLTEPHFYDTGSVAGLRQLAGGDLDHWRDQGSQALPLSGPIWETFRPGLGHEDFEDEEYWFHVEKEDKESVQRAMDGLAEALRLLGLGGGGEDGGGRFLLD